MVDVQINQEMINFAAWSCFLDYFLCGQANIKKSRLKETRSGKSAGDLQRFWCEVIRGAAAGACPSPHGQVQWEAKESGRGMSSPRVYA